MNKTSSVELKPVQKLDGTTKLYVVQLPKSIPSIKVTPAKEIPQKSQLSNELVITLDPNQVQEPGDKSPQHTDSAKDPNELLKPSLDSQNYYQDRINNSANTLKTGLYRKCPVCKELQYFSVSHRIAFETHIAALAMMCICCCLAPIPYLTKRCKRSIFTCNQCKVSFSSI